ncbi:Alpha/Beta hydrolase protein [Xylariaceae sp. FL0016]|nr:Alpha/Beta hydrolase protein [Xylariaceae sp. FL0016]
MCDFTIYGTPHPEWLAAASSLPTPPPGLNIQETRKYMNDQREKIAATSMRLLGHQVSLHDHRIPARDGSLIEARSYRPVSARLDAILPVYVHLHGGGFFFGTLSSEDGMCARIAINAGVVVLNVNYRHTPEFTYPTAWHDTHDAFAWLHAHISEPGIRGDPDRVVMGGISAGAQLTASFALQQHLGKVAPSLPSIKGQVLMIPCLVNQGCYAKMLSQIKDPRLSSYVQNENAPILSVKTMRFFDQMLKTNPDPDDLVLNPGNAAPEQVRGLPPTVFGITGLDPLRDEGLLYARMLTEAGVPTDVNMFSGLPHGFRRAGDKIQDSERWDRVMERGVLWVLDSPVSAGEFEIKTK